MGDTEFPPGPSWSNLSGKPTVPEGVSFTQYAQDQLEHIRAVAEARFEAGLGQHDMDAGLYDVFAATDKVASTAGDVAITAGSNGVASFSAGDGNTASVSTGGQDTANQNTRGLIFNPNETLLGIKVDFSGNVNCNDMDLRIHKGRKESGSVVGEVTGVSTDGGPHTIPAVLVAGQDYTVVMHMNNNGYELSASQSYPVTTGDVDVVSGWYNGSEDGSNNRSFTSLTARVPSGTSGSFTSTRQSLGFTPSKAVVECEGDIKSGFELDLEDDSGHTVTVPDEDFGTEVDVSSFADGDVRVVGQFSGATVLEDYRVMFV